MKKRTKFIIIAIAVAIIVAIIILINMLNTSNGVPKAKLEQKGYEIFENDYCLIDHSMEFGGDALTPWTCKLCGTNAVNPDTNVPEICSNCARITGRCMYCGKLKKERLWKNVSIWNG